MAELRRDLHQRAGDPHQLRRHVPALLPRSLAGRLTGLVERRGGLLHPARDRVGDRRLPEREWVGGEGVEKGLAARRSLGILLRREFEFRAGGHQAGPAGRLRLQPLHLIKRRGDLVALDQRVELLEVPDEVGAAELDLLAGAAGTGGIGVDGHEGKPLRSLGKC